MHSPLVDDFRRLLRVDPAAAVAHFGGASYTRADLRARADEVLALLADTPREARIALSVRDGFAFLACFLAIAECGSAAILLDAADPRAPRLDLAAQLGAVTALVDDPELRAIACAGPHELAAEGLRAIKLTSGSTGEPRAIGVGDRELLADAAALEGTMGIGDGDRVLAAVPMSFSYGVGNLLVPALARGRELVLPPPGPLGLLAALRSAQPTVLPAVPALLRALLQGRFAAPASLRLVLSAGAVLPPDVAARFRTRFGLPVHAFYGSTESGGISYDRVGDAAERGTVGQPVDGVTLAFGADGRVIVQSAAVGTLLDEHAMLPSAVSSVAANPSGGRFVAPDLGELRNGELCLRGRSGTVFDVGGHKVDPAEVEGLIRTLPGVREVAVLPWRDEHGRACCAAIIAGDVAERDVQQHCARLLPAAKVPRCCVVLAAADLPRTDRGKLRRDQLLALLPGSDQAAASGLPQ
ncbi:MAG: class I adenylate-forming enzyme family protein [Planctomycetota bacterium]